MSLSVCRLELAEVGRSDQVGPQACQHESLQDLGHGRQVGDRPVVPSLEGPFFYFAGIGLLPLFDRPQWLMVWFVVSASIFGSVM